MEELKEGKKRSKDVSDGVPSSNVSEAIDIYRQVFLRFPAKAQWPVIDERVKLNGDTLDIEHWRECCKEMLSRNKGVDFSRLFDWYENGIQEWVDGKLIRRQDKPVRYPDL